MYLIEEISSQLRPRVHAVYVNIKKGYHEDFIKSCSGKPFSNNAAIAIGPQIWTVYLWAACVNVFFLSPAGSQEIAVNCRLMIQIVELCYFFLISINYSSNKYHSLN